jgi:hypothetical protein
MSSENDAGGTVIAVVIGFALVFFILPFLTGGC